MSEEVPKSYRSAMQEIVRLQTGIIAIGNAVCAEVERHDRNFSHNNVHDRYRLLNIAGMLTELVYND